MSKINLFEPNNRQKKLNTLNDPLKKLFDLVDFELYREELVSMYKTGTEKGGRPPYDPVKMFKIILLQKLYNLSDEQTEFQINDRNSFQKFIGVSGYESLPDAKTIWIFRERLKKEGLEEILFNKLYYWIQKSGFILKEGAIIDASIVSVPIQRNTKEENEQIKEGQTPPEWKEEQRKLAQKDRDASWTKKHNKSYYGYKNHVIVDSKSKIIRDYDVTTASVHDSQVLEDLVGEVKKEEPFFGDSAYSSKESKAVTEKQGSVPLFCIKGCRNNPLTEGEKTWNKILSKVRCRVEHVFGDIKSFAGNKIRTIGIGRAKTQIFIGNFLYNLRRVSYLLRAKSA